MSHVRLSVGAPEELFPSAMLSGPAGHARENARMRGVSVVVLVALISLLAPNPATAADEPDRGPSFVVKVEANRLTIRLRGIPLDAALRAIARECGVGFASEVRLDERISLALDGAPLDEAFKRLLGSHSYILVYTSATKEQEPGLTHVKVTEPRTGTSDPMGQHQTTMARSRPAPRDSAGRDADGSGLVWSPEDAYPAGNGRDADEEATEAARWPRTGLEADD